MCTCIKKKKKKKKKHYHSYCNFTGKNENRDKDGQSGVFMPFGVIKQKSTLAAYIALKKNNVDVALLYTVIKT